MTEPLLLQSYGIMCLISFVLCCVIVISARYGFSRRSELDALAIQNAHSGFVPRAGGLAIFISILGFIPFSTVGFIPMSLIYDLNMIELSLIILSAAPVFIVGLAEDLGFYMDPKKRLLASVASGLLVISFFNVWVNKLGVHGLDTLLSFAPFGIAFTLFGTSGVVNAFNLVDGINGLSGYISMSIAVALSILAFEVDNIQLLLFLSIIVSTTAGFMLLNFPLGKIFMGDAGAYVLGHLLVWCAIMLVNFDEKISTFAILMIFFWPIADTSLAIWRRWKLGSPAVRPDRLHFHQLVMRYLEIRIFGRGRRHLSNPTAAIILVPFITTPQILAVILWDKFELTVWATLASTVVFIMTYIIVVNQAKNARSIGHKT